MSIDLAKNGLCERSARYGTGCLVWQISCHSSGSVAVDSFFNWVLNLGDVRGVVETNRRLVVEIDFPIRPGDAVPIGLDPLEDCLMRFTNRVVGTMMNRGRERSGG